MRQPTLFVDDDGVFQNASQEMLYSEQGHFEIMGTTAATDMPRVPFSRKYIWRLKEDKSAAPEISVWFVKPGTEKLDYLFHKVLFQHSSDSTRDGKIGSEVECAGGHLCVEDLYSSIYQFSLECADGGPVVLPRWKMSHEVVGPQKDQIIETVFDRA